MLFIVVGISSQSISQLGGKHNYLDTAYIAPREMGDQKDFLENKRSFPAKPRDLWQVGGYIGFPYVDGDVPMAAKGAANDLGNYAYGFGVQVRKSLGYVLSVRASFSYVNMLGLDYQRNRNYNNHSLVQTLYLPVGNGYVHNHRTRAFIFGIDGIVSLNNIMFHAKQTRWSVYALAGYSAFYYHTTMDVTNYKDFDKRYLFETIDYTKPRVEIRKQLRKMLDGTYETKAEVNDRRPGSKDSWQLRHSFNAGVGIEYRVGKNWSLSAEYKRIQPRDDYVDGYYRQSGDLANPVFTSEWDNVVFTTVGANFNIGNSKKRIAPLWWMNPLEYAYSELNFPKHMKISIKLDDDDGDNVTNQFDLEPNTPKGAPVDANGVAKDTDGDGVPDYKDKELLTLQKCFPVDADGVGKCPESECCKTIEEKLKNCCDNRDSSNPYRPTNSGKNGDCSIGDLPSIQFNQSSIKINRDAEAILITIAQRMKDNPDCKVVVIGYCNSSKLTQQRSWDRVNVVINYMVEKQGISMNRFIFKYAEPGGDCESIDFMGTKENGPNSVPAPHPNLKKSK